jgi:alkanesulfonate monooxygenase
MPVEMIGWIAPQVSSEMIPPEGPVFDAATVAEAARIHEPGDFDRVLIGYFSDAPDGFMIGAQGAMVTEKLGFLLAHRPGFVNPPLAARKLAPLDQLSNGRLAVHIIAGGSDADQAMDADHSDHAMRYRRSTEYIQLLRKTWTETGPFDHEGEFCKTKGTHSAIRCLQEPHIPIYGGGSDAAIAALAPELDVFMLWGEPLKETATFKDRVTKGSAGRKPTFSLSTRPILAETEDKAWERAHRILDRVMERRGGMPAPKPGNVGSRRLLAAAAEGEVHDSCLWTKLAVATGAQGNWTALVGTPDTVAEAMVEYCKLGASSLLILGYDPRPDAEQYGAEFIPRVRELVAKVDAGML